MTDAQQFTPRYGANHLQVVEYLYRLGQVTPDQWRARYGGWTTENLASRNRLADYVSLVAIERGMVEAFDQAGRIAWNIAYAAVEPFANAEFDPDFALGYMRTAASEASLAAQALVMRPMIFPDEFAELYNPMPRAGINPDTLLV